jgi:PAS domain-containing protein
MHPHFNPQQLIMLFGGALLVGSAVILGVYLLQKSLGRTLNPKEPKAAKVRVDDEAAFTLATVKGVLAQLTSDQKATQEKLAAAERRAEENAHKFEILAREIDCGLMLFDADGFITYSNPLVRKVLAVDTWSRRRHGEIFHDLPAFSKLIDECVATGTDIRKNPVELQGSDGSKRRVEVSVLTTRDRSGKMEVIACMFREMTPAAPDA